MGKRDPRSEGSRMRIVIAEIYPDVKAIANSFFSWSGPLLPPLRAYFLLSAGRGPFLSEYSPLRPTQGYRPPGRRGFSIDVIRPALYTLDDRDVKLLSLTPKFPLKLSTGFNRGRRNADSKGQGCSDIKTRSRAG